jgi:hypothetical protein
MRFLGMLYVSIEAPSEYEAKQILEDIEVTSEDEDDEKKASWYLMAREID